MKTYYAIKNADGRYLKIRANGKTRNWVEELKSATVKTEAQMKGALEALQNSPYHEGCTLVAIGEGFSAWDAKLRAVKGYEGNI